MIRGMTLLLGAHDTEMLNRAIEQARISLDSHGIPVGAVLASNGRFISAGHNERVQVGDPIAHGEMACLRNAGRQASYREMTLYTTLAPCQMCSGAILLFQIPRVVVGEDQTFAGHLDFLSSRGVEVILVSNEHCISMMNEFQKKYPEIWSEDIGRS